MKYLLRSFKYLVYFVLIFFLCILIIRLAMRGQRVPLVEMFEEGAFTKIAIIFAAFALVYPLVGYKKGRLTLDGEWSAYRDAVVKTMTGAQYNLVSEEGGVMKFRSSRAAIRLSRMWEDAITFTPLPDGIHVEVDGPTRDTTRIISSIYYNYRMQNPQSEE